MSNETLQNFLNKRVKIFTKPNNFCYKGVLKSADELFVVLYDMKFGETILAKADISQINFDDKTQNCQK